MRILLTTPNYPPFNSGLGNAVQQQARILVDAGCSVTVATGGEGRVATFDSRSGARVEHFAVEGADVLFNRIRGSSQDYVDFLLGEQFDLVLFNAWQNWATDLALPLLARIKGRKMLYSHCISTNLRLPPGTLRAWVKYLAWRPYWLRLPGVMRELDGLVFLAAEGCDSRFDDLRTARQLGLSYAVVPNAVSEAACALLESAPLAHGERSQLVAIGSWDWFKGHDFVLRAYAASQLKNRVPLKLFGQRFSAYTERLRALAHTLALSPEKVSFHEGVSGEALLEECARSRLLVSGSWTECQPLVLLDAMAAGTPFLARACGCIPSLPGGVAVASEAEAAQTMSQLWDDEPRWTSMMLAGRAHARADHDPRVFARRLLRALGLRTVEIGNEHG